MRNTGTSRRGVSVRRGELSAQRTEGLPFSAPTSPQKASLFLRTPPRPAAIRAAPTRAATPLPPPRRSPFQALRILWTQPEQRAYLYTLTEHLKEYEWL